MVQKPHPDEIKARMVQKPHPGEIKATPIGRMVQAWSGAGKLGSVIGPALPGQEIYF